MKPGKEIAAVEAAYQDAVKAETDKLNKTPTHARFAHLAHGLKLKALKKARDRDIRQANAKAVAEMPPASYTHLLPGQKKPAAQNTARSRSSVYSLSEHGMPIAGRSRPNTEEDEVMTKPTSAYAHLKTAAPAPSALRPHKPAGHDAGHAFAASVEAAVAASEGREPRALVHGPEQHSLHVSGADILKAARAHGKI